MKIVTGQDGLLLRSDTTDGLILRESLVDRIYDTDCHQRAAHWGHGAAMQRRYLEILRSGRTPWIYNMGAHVGSSAVWFGRAWPLAYQLCVEPDPGSFELLEQNLRAHGNEGLWEARRLAVGRPGVGHMKSFDGHPAGFRVWSGEGAEEVSIVSPESLMPVNPRHWPFICKVDIEGGELEVFEGQCEWIDKFSCVMVEIHDYLMPGCHVSQGLLSLLARGSWDVIIRGDVLQCFNNATLDYVGFHRFQP